MGWNCIRRAQTIAVADDDGESVKWKVGHAARGTRILFLDFRKKVLAVSFLLLCLLCFFIAILLSCVFVHARMISALQWVVWKWF